MQNVIILTLTIKEKNFNNHLEISYMYHNSLW